MTNLHDARVEAAAKAIAANDGIRHALNPEYVEAYMQDARAALAAADAVVTVEMITEAIAKVTDIWDEPLDEVYDIPPIARAVLALIRGGGEQR